MLSAASTRANVNFRLLELKIELQGIGSVSQPSSRVRTLNQVNIREKIEKSVPDFIHATPSYVADLIEVLPIGERYPFLLLHLHELPPSYCYLKILSNINKKKFADKAGSNFVQTANDLVSYVECFPAKEQYDLAVASFNPATMKDGIGKILNVFNEKNKIAFVEAFLKDLIPNCFEAVVAALQPQSRKEFVIKHFNLLMTQDINALPTIAPKLITLIPEAEQTETAREIINLLPQKKILYNSVVAKIIKNIPEVDRAALTFVSLLAPRVGDEYCHIANLPFDQQLRFALGLKVKSQREMRTVLLELPRYWRYKYISTFPQYLLSVDDVLSFSTYLTADKTKDFIREQMSRLIQQDVVKFSQELAAYVEKNGEDENLLTLPVVKNAIMLITQRLKDYAHAIRGEKTFLSSLTNFLGTKYFKFMIANQMQAQLRTDDKNVLIGLMALKNEWVEDGRLGAIFKSLLLLYVKKNVLQHEAQKLKEAKRAEAIAAMPPIAPATLKSAKFARNNAIVFQPADEKIEVKQVKEDPNYEHPDDEEKVPLPDETKEAIHLQQPQSFEEYDPAAYVSEEEDDGSPEIVFEPGASHQPVITEPAPRPGLIMPEPIIEPILPSVIMEPAAPRPESILPSPATPWLSYILAASVFTLGILACATGVGALLGLKLLSISLSSLGTIAAASVGGSGVVLVGTGIYAGVSASHNAHQTIQAAPRKLLLQPAHPGLYHAFLPNDQMPFISPVHASKSSEGEEAPEFKIPEVKVKVNVNPGAVGVFKKRPVQQSANNSTLTQLVRWIKRGFY